MACDTWQHAALTLFHNLPIENVVDFTGETLFAITDGKLLMANEKKRGGGFNTFSAVNVGDSTG